MNYLSKSVILATLFILTGCEIGTKGGSSSGSGGVESGIVTKGGTQHKAQAPVKRIYSKSGTPGYYIQVGYFQENRPSEEFINRVKFSGLSYQLVKKYNGDKLGEYALIGPYISYNKAKEILVTAKEFVTSNAFIVKVVRP